jgi:deazaflavin-dependent oxidoreductase (nitroreductase family)
MPLPRWLARVTRLGNPFIAPFAAYLPWFGILEHLGRRTGTVRRIPINAFPRGGRYVIALTYGAEVQWLANVLAAGGCRLRTRGRWLTLRDPRRFRDPQRRAVPWSVRLVLAALRVDEFVELRVSSTPGICRHGT